MADAHGVSLLPVDEALARIADTLQPIRGHEQLPLVAALNRVLAQDVESPLDVPGHRNSAMDGYAVAAGDLPETGERGLRVVGTALAGVPFSGTLASGEAVRIMTGAVVPEGADTVIMQEKTRREGDTVYVGPARSGDNVRHPGEDIASGQTVLPAGRRLVPADLGLLASLGIAEVKVRRPIRVAVFSTGDELAPLGAPLANGQIYDSNRYTLNAMLRRLSAEVIDMGVVRDHPEAIADAFRSAADIADVVITSGGVSVGEADFVKATLDELGQVDFWRIAMKPGKPLAFGMLGSTAFFGLPGNPVSVMATFYQIVQPSLQRLAGEQPMPPLRLRVPTSTKLKKRPGRQDFQRGILEPGPDGQLTVRSTGGQGSHILSSMSHANCFIVLPAASGDVEAGAIVEVQPFAGLV